MTKSDLVENLKVPHLLIIIGRSGNTDLRVFNLRERKDFFNGEEKLFRGGVKLIT